MAVRGVDTDTAAALLVAVGEDPGRLNSESAFAHMCGVASIPASSGKVVRYRLNRGGNRDANRALHMVCVVRMREPRTREYVARRTAERKSKREIMRCLKRYVAPGSIPRARQYVDASDPRRAWALLTYRSVTKRPDKWFRGPSASEKC